MNVQTYETSESSVSRTQKPATSEKRKTFSKRHSMSGHNYVYYTLDRDDMERQANGIMELIEEQALSRMD